MPAASARRCFVIAPIGDIGSETRRRSDQVMRHLIEPAASECGYEAIRADRISEPGLITTQVIEQIMDVPMVVADLSEQNPNVFYELAIRHAVGKPLVQIIREGERIPFDVSGMRTIQFNHQDLDSVAEAKTELTKQIRSVEMDPSRVHSPLSTAINLQALRVSEQPAERLLGEIATSIGRLRADVARLQQRDLSGSLAAVLRGADTYASIELPVAGIIQRPPNFIDPKRYLCRTHLAHPAIKGNRDGTVTVHACCQPFFSEVALAFNAGPSS